MLLQSLVFALMLGSSGMEPAPVSSSLAPPSSSVIVDAGLPVVVPPATPEGLPEAPADGDVPDIIFQMLEAYQKGDSRLALVFALMLVMWALRKTLLKSISENKTDLLPWITLAMASAGGGILALKAGKPLGQVAVSGALIGLAASGGWSLVGKHAMKLVPLAKVLVGLVKERLAKPAPAPVTLPTPPPEQK